MTQEQLILPFLLVTVISLQSLHVSKELVILNIDFHCFHICIKKYRERNNRHNIDLSVEIYTVVYVQ